MNNNDFNCIDEHSIILTPNRRLSATLAKLYQQHQIKEQQTVWQTPQIMPLNSWLQTIWQKMVDASIQEMPQLLSTSQTQLLWESILKKSNRHAHLLQLSETAEMAKSAYTLLKQWMLSPKHPLFTQSDDYADFAEWCKSFENCCAKKKIIEQSHLPHLIKNAIQDGLLEKPQKIILFGFTELSPLLKQLIETYEQAGVIITEQSYHQNISAHRINLPNEDQEILSMARWAKSIYQHNKEARIACVIPKLDKYRDRVIQLFSAVFNDTNYHHQDLHEYPFNISAGKSLASYPIIHAALQILSLFKKSISRELFTDILGSPFIGEAEKEKNIRFKFEEYLRKNNITSLSLSALCNSQQGLPFKDYCPLLANRISNLLALADQRKRHFYEWAAYFNTLLKTLGWPGERSLSSEEYQTVEAWVTLLAEFANLDYLLEPHALFEALGILKNMANNHFFQAETPETTIQVLGMLEAAGLPFDYVWLASMDDLSWPPQPSPNPFIPKQLQREHEMPHASSERELHFSQILTDQFISASKHIIFSHAEHLEKIQTKISPLLRHKPTIEINQLGFTDYQSATEKVFHSAQIESVLDELALPIDPNEIQEGGIDILKQQAQCPFKSFAQYRLYARELEQPLPGLRPKDRGKLIHCILQYAWEQIADHQNLLTLSTQELDHIVLNAIEKAFAKEKNLKYYYHDTYLKLEIKRLAGLITDWLITEKDRETFTVLSHEKSEKITLNRLMLSIRIDRIDQLANGQKLVIDYKTGKSNTISHWFGDRPEDPQLPLYAILDPIHTAGIAFAQVATGASQFIGLSRYPLQIKGVKLFSEMKENNDRSWEEHIQDWRQTLEKLSDDFSSGIAKVDPKDAKQTCQRCDIKPLCRINEHMAISYEN